MLFHLVVLAWVLSVNCLPTGKSKNTDLILHLNMLPEPNHLIFTYNELPQVEDLFLERYRMNLKHKSEIIRNLTVLADEWELVSQAQSPIDKIATHLKYLTSKFVTLVLDPHQKRLYRGTSSRLNEYLQEAVTFIDKFLSTDESESTIRDIHFNKVLTNITDILSHLRESYEEYTFLQKFVREIKATEKWLDRVTLHCPNIQRLLNHSKSLLSDALILQNAIQIMVFDFEALLVQLQFNCKPNEMNERRMIRFHQIALDLAHLMVVQENLIDTIARVFN